MSKTCILCHIVFGTKKRKPAIPSLSKPDLYRYIAGIIKGKNCNMITINGMPDHLHLLVDLHPSVPVAELVRAVKQSSTNMMKDNPSLFPWFEGWGRGYFASSVSPKLKEACKKYISEQEIHHGGEGFVIELRYLIEKNGLEWFPDEWE